jgi:tetratricopeptide (TPR) repeat protein
MRLFTFSLACLLCLPVVGQPVSAFEELETLSQRGDFTALRQRAGEVLAAARQGPDRASLAVALNWNAVAVMQLGDFDVAARNLAEALDVSRKLDNNRLFAYTLLDLARLDAFTGRYCEAEKKATNSLKADPGLKSPDSLLTLANSQIGCEHNSLAIATIEEALQLLPADAPRHQRAPLWAIRATIARMEGQLDVAKDYLARAIEAMESKLGRENPDLIYPLIELAAIERKTGHIDRARQHASRAVAIAENRLPAKIAALWPVYEEYSTILRANGEKKAASRASQKAEVLRAAAGPSERDLKVRVNSLLPGKR